MKKAWMIGISLVLLSSTTFAGVKNAPPSEVNQFIQTLVTNDHFKKQPLERLFHHLHKDQSILNSMHGAFEKTTWSQYRAFFINKKRVTSGVRFWSLHSHFLSEIEKQYGIPASLIVAIIGVESDYGSHEGDHPIANSLYTLAFYAAHRAAFFKEELRQFLLLSRENHLHTLTLKGSYAGALGLPQFMPSSYRHYGISGRHRPVVNLFDSPNDAIASIANFLKQNGWSPNQPIATSFKIKSPGETEMLAFNENNNVKLWRVFPNFKTILHYNHSQSYAMVVYQLSQEIKKYHDRAMHHHRHASSSTRKTRRGQKSL